MIYVCGDIHSYLNIHKLNSDKWPIQNTLDKKDILIILGDFGLIWNATLTKDEKYWLNWLLDKPCQIAFVDGNHENFDRIDSFPICRKWYGKVQKVFTNSKGKSIYRLRRGEIYNICDKKIFTYGGGTSIDKHHRIEYISWWRQEIPSNVEFESALNNLKKNDFKVDYVLSHTAPMSIYTIISKVFSYLHKDICLCSDQLEFFFKHEIKFKEWHFGHYHIDNGKNPLCFEDKFFAHYNNEPFLLV